MIQFSAPYYPPHTNTTKNATLFDIESTCTEGLRSVHRLLAMIEG